MSQSPLDFVRHIKAELDYLEEASAELSEEAFGSDETLKRAFARSLEIIGEATKKLDKDFTDKYPEVPWSYMAKLRDKLIHHYFGIDYQLVYSILRDDLPSLRESINSILSE
jgi:uncharacterized protein with HEPN domain